MQANHMNIFGDKVDYTKYKDDIKDSTPVENVKGCYFGISKDVEILNRKGVMPRIKKSKGTSPKPDFYDLDILDDLPMDNKRVTVYHDMLNQYMATNVINNASAYLHFGACVIKFINIPKWVNYNSFLESIINVLRKTGRNSTILKCEGENDCILVQSKTFTGNIKDTLVEYVRNFIFKSKEASDYTNVTINLQNIVNTFDKDDFRSVAGDCVDRCNDTDKLVRRLESTKSDILALFKCGDSVGIDETLADTIINYAKTFFNDNLQDFTLLECLNYIDSKLPKSAKAKMALKTGNSMLYAITYIDRMLDSIEDFQLWGDKAC